MEAQQHRNPFLIPLEGSVIFFACLEGAVLLASIVKIQINSLLSASFLVISLLIAGAYIFMKNKQSGQPYFPFINNRLHRNILILAILGIVGIYVLLWFLATVSPDLSWDGNAYHIPPISMWASQGHVYWVDTHYLESIINGYPKGAEVIAYILALTFGNAALNTVNLLFIPLGILGIASLSCSLGTQPLFALFAGMLYVLIPVNVNQASTTYVDAAFAACIIALCAIWLNAIQNTTRNSMAWSVPLGAAIGLAISIKSTGIALGGLSLVILFLAALKGLSFRNATEKKPIFSGWMNLALAFLLTGVVLVAVGGYWYIRNYIHTGSPLYPVGISLAGHTIFPGLSIADAISQASNTPQEIAGQSGVRQVLFTWLQNISKWPVSIKGYDARLAGIGFLWIAGCIPAILIFSILNLKKQSFYKTGYILLIFLVTLVFFMTPMNWWARYTFWIYAIGLPAFAWVLETFVNKQSQNKAWMSISHTWLVLSILVALFEGLYCTADVIALSIPGSLNGSVTALFRSETWKWPANYLLPDINSTALDEIIVNDKIVAIGPHGESSFTEYTSLVGELSQPIGGRILIFLSEEPTIEEIRSFGIESIVWDSSIPAPHFLADFERENVDNFTIIRTP